MPSEIPASQLLGAKQLSLYLKERGVDPARIPAAAIQEFLELANETVDLTSLRSSQAMVMYMGELRAQSEVIASYCKGPATSRRGSDQDICDILKKHGVVSAS
jgi:hypothetical protein